MAKKITVYTSNSCAYCMMVKKYLNGKGHAYEEVNIDQNPERRQEAHEVSGVMATPITVISDGSDAKDVIVGFNLPKLTAALA